jgi:phosphatidylinositol dimannoside acyltransferase
VCRMPGSWARWLFARIADALWWRRGPGVRQLEANLRRVLGPGASAAEVRRLARKGMQSYLRYWLEVFRLPVIPRDRIVAGMHINSDQEKRAFGHLAAGRGVIFALPHTGNYEQAGAYIVLAGAGSFTTVAERLASSAVYDRFLGFRQSLGMEVIPHAGGADPSAVLAQRLRDGHLVCLVCDRDLSASGVEVEFFGERARMAAGPAALAVETGAALMPVTLWFEGEDWGARIYPEVPVPEDGDRREKIAAMSQQMARDFEHGIAGHPQDWHMLQKVFVADLDRRRLAAAGAHGQPDAPGGLPPDATTTPASGRSFITWKRRTRLVRVLSEVTLRLSRGNEEPSHGGVPSMTHVKERLAEQPGMRAVRRQLGRLAQSPGWPLRSGEDVPRWAVMSAGLAPVVLVCGWLVGDSLQPRTYSPIRDTVSVLAGLDGTDRWIMTWALLVICGCYVVTAIGLAGLGLPARLLLILAGMCSAGIAASPEPPSGPTTAHLAWTAVGGVTIAIWPAVAGWHLQERPLVLSARPSIVVSVLFVGLLGWVALETRGGKDLGLAERLDSGVQTCWPFVVALVLRHGARGEASPEPADRGEVYQAEGREEDWPSDPTCRC